MVRRTIAFLLSLSLLSLNPGWSHAASVFRGAPKAPAAQAAPLPKLNPLALLPTPGSQVGLPPGALTPAPAAPAPAAAPSALGLLPTPGSQTGNILSEHLQAVAAPALSGDDAHTAGANIQNLLEGRRTAQLSGPVAGAEGRGAPALGKPSQNGPSGVENDRASYNKRRAALKELSKKGVVASLPKAGAELTASLLAEAGAKKALFTDFDDTIGVFNSVLTAEVASALVAVKKAGKTVIVVTDRTDEKRPNSKMLTVFESLASIPAEERAGMYVAANNGGRVYKFDERGEPVKLYEVPSIDAAEKAVIEQAAQAVKSRLSEIGTTQHPGDAVSPSESFNPYGYAMMLAVGTPEATVKVAAKALQQELASRGIEVEVLARMAKDPKNPPYITYSRMNKSVPVAWLANHLGIKAQDAVAVGDSMFMPRLPESVEKAAAEQAEALSGAPMPLTGNETDRNMEKGLPGMMALSVGGTADPRMDNAWVLEGKGPEQTLKLLEAMASRPLAPPSEKLSKMDVVAVIAMLAAGIAGWVMLAKIFAGIFSGAYQSPLEIPEGWHGPIPSIDEAFGLLGMAGVIGKDKIKQAWKAWGEKWATGLLLAASVAGALGVWYMLFKSIADTAAGNVTAPVMPEGMPYYGPIRGWEDLFSMGVMGGMLGMMMKPNLMPNPSRDYKLALKQAVKLAAERGYTDDQVYFGGATASLPRRGGEEWKYAFYMTRDPLAGKAEVLYVDIVTGYTVGPDFRTQHFTGVKMPEEWTGAHELSLPIGVEEALAAARKLVPGLSSAVSVELTPSRGYKLYDGAGNIVHVDADQGYAVPVRYAPAKSRATSKLAEKVKTFLNSWWSIPLAIPLAMGAAMLTGQMLMTVGGAMALSAVAVHVYAGVKNKGQDLVWAEFFLLYGGLATMFFAGVTGAILAAVFASLPFFGGSTAPAGVSDADVESAAKSVISYKGGVWSHTEYNMGYYNTLESLKRRGATEAQLARFKKLCDEAPVKGGRFNPWSGD